MAEIWKKGNDILLDAELTEEGQRFLNKIKDCMVGPFDYISEPDIQIKMTKVVPGPPMMKPITPSGFHYDTISPDYMHMRVSDLLEFLNKEAEKNSEFKNYEVEIGEYSLKFCGKKELTKEEYQKEYERYKSELNIYVEKMKKYAGELPDRLDEKA